jgi:hypothetical protein
MSQLGVIFLSVTAGRLARRNADLYYNESQNEELADWQD